MPALQGIHGWPAPRHVGGSHRNQERRPGLWTLVLGAAVAVAGLGPGLGLLSGSPPAAADPIQECSTTTGVIVVVDFAPWGGNIVRGCDSTLTTGYDALNAAGFTPAGDAHDGPAFVCRIDNDPPPSQDPCITTPPTSAYWSYWHADVGQNTWSYSQLGAMSYHPPPGSVDAWVFGASNVAGTTGQPSFTPAQVRATNVGPPITTTTAPTTSPTSSGGGGTSPPLISNPSGPGPGSTNPGGPVSAASSGTRSTTSPKSGSTTTTTSSTIATSTSTSKPQSKQVPSGASGNSGGPGRSSPKIVNASATTAKQPSAGSPLPFVVGAVVVVAFLGGATAVALRRRRAAQAQEE
jgi:hypothetical protein